MEIHAAVFKNDLDALHEALKHHASQIDSFDVNGWLVAHLPFLLTVTMLSSRSLSLQIISSEMILIEFPHSL